NIVILLIVTNGTEEMANQAMTIEMLETEIRITIRMMAIITAKKKRKMTIGIEKKTKKINGRDSFMEWVFIFDELKGSR
ncbi:hypothetical protein R0J90_13980, partial [Micrococcus sp. SIMBA_144]